MQLLGARWATPVLLVFSDTAIIYNLLAACCSFALAARRRIYHTNQWSSVVRRMPESVRLFSEKILAPRGVDLLPHFPLTLEWYLWDAPSVRERLQRYEVSVEAASAEWAAFGTAWNRIVCALRNDDYLSDQGAQLASPLTSSA